MLGLDDGAILGCFLPNHANRAGKDTLQGMQVAFLALVTHLWPGPVDAPVVRMIFLVVGC